MKAQQEEFSLKRFFVPLTTFKAIHIIVIVGVIVFFSGLFNNFVGDDFAQIVNNPYVHSIQNISAFFSGGTFYNGNGLTGVYYKPLLTTYFSFINTIFGNSYFFFHFFQLVLHITNATLVFILFTNFFKKNFSLFLALIFLVHPINSETVYFISNTQDVLFFFFGIVALLLLIHFKTKKYIATAVVCLFLSILSKETGILFFGVVILYTFLFNKKNFIFLFSILLSILIIYILLRIQAIGIFTLPLNAPISQLDLSERMINIPEIVFFYLKAFVYPLNLVSSYQWVHTNITFINFLLPLFIIVLFLISVTSLGWFIYKKHNDEYSKLFVLFNFWLFSGLVLHLQIVPLDATVAERWFYFPMVGLLGILGLAFSTIYKNLKKTWIIILIIILILLAIRTFVRGFDWNNDYILVVHDIQVSKNSYVLEYKLSSELAKQGRFDEAKIHAERSITLYPYFTNYNTLGTIYLNLNDYGNAEKAFLKGLQFGNYYPIYENLALLYLNYGDPKKNIQFIKGGVKHFPQSSKLWLYLAILEYKSKNIHESKEAIYKAYSLSKNQQTIAVYNKIMNNEPLDINVKFTIDQNN